MRDSHLSLLAVAGVSAVSGGDDMTDGLPHRNGSWRNAAIGAFGGIAMLFAGWMLNEAATERRSMEAQINDNRQRLATLEEAVRGLRAQVYELRRRQDEVPK